MRKGLTLTLMTVAVAMLGIQAMAYAPVISELPSPVVGDQGWTTGANRFVYPDAFNLGDYVSDDNTADSAIKWSYEVGSPVKYNINGVAPINSSTEDPKTPGTKQINNQDLDASKVDTDPQTITIRNVHLSPISGDQVDPGSTTGPIDAETQLVTLYASDGTTYSSRTMFVYTDNGGSDRLSRPTGATATTVKSWTFDGSTNGFTFTTYGGVTSGTSGSTSICMTVGLTGDNYGLWAGPISDIPLVLNSVYHVRVNVNGSHTSAGATPYWDMYLNNFDGTKGLNLFGADILFYDGDGGANAALQVTGGGKAFHLWWTPLPVLSTAWNNGTTGAKSTENEANDGNKLGLVFRVLDIGSRTDLNTRTQDGTLCMTDAMCERYALSDMRVVTAADQVYNNTSFSAANSGGTGTIIVSSLLGTNPTIDYTGGILTITPSTATSSLDLLNIDPGTDLLYDLANGSTIDDNYPVKWNTGELLQITAELTAADATSESDPPDAIQFGVDGPGNEVIMSSFITRLGAGASAKCGMPKTSEWVPYMAFFATHSESLSPSSWYHYLRPRMTVINNSGVTGSGVANAGKFRARNLKVQKVAF